MKNIIFIAPPAAGKGTQSELLVKKYGYVHISTGDLLRSEIASGSELGKSITEIMDSGNLVGDDIVTELLKNRLSQDDAKKGFILDGYPRNIDQAKTLEELASELNIDLGIAVYLEMSEELAMHRALGRITCPTCGRGYNKYEDAMKPKNENHCDDCHVELTSRSDDNEETFKTRFATYIKNTQALLEYYKDSGMLNVIDNSGTPEETFARIESVI